MSDEGVALARRLFLHVKDGGSVTVMDMSRLVMAVESIQTQRDMAQGERMRLAGELSSASSSLAAWVEKASVLEAERDTARAALRDIASGRYSNIMLPTHPPQDPAVVRARDALRDSGR